MSRRPIIDGFDFADLTARFVAVTEPRDGLYMAPRDLKHDDLAIVPPRFVRSGL